MGQGDSPLVLRRRPHFGEKIMGLLDRFFRKKQSSDRAAQSEKKQYRCSFGGEERGLLFRTKGDSEPYGKLRVYISCHPQDFALYFEEIAKDIFETQNCVICYRDPEIVYTEEEIREFMKGSFSLVVIPVTTRLLREPNPAMDIEFPAAVENHIPVLPLMQEEGLDELYKERFGTLHYLDKNIRDITALDFMEKLKRFLARVMVGDEEAAMIRAAFDAYIFMSYRKIDREYAQKLMRLIHKNADYRSIAIWYDEYLVPGESFEKTIISMLLKSRLFLLVVTSNLVTSDNYVKNKEYPEAKKHGKKIVAVEMLPLDEEERLDLKEYYPDIPDCVHPGNSQELYEEVKEKLGRIAKKESSDQPVHTFCIGLAYLKGVDVEVDHELALKLITRAWDEGLPEAASKLGDMYTIGEGVGRDFSQAVIWRQRYEKCRAEQFRRKPDSESGREWFRSLRALEEAYKNAGCRKEALSACRQAADLAKRSDFSWSREYGAECFADLGYYEFEEQNFASARDYYNQAERELPGTGNPFLQAILWERRSLVSKRLGDTAQAAEEMKNALRIREGMAGPGAKPAVKSAIALTYLLLGDIIRNTDRGEARRYYQKALKTYKSLTAETGSVRDRDGLEVCLCAMAEISGDPGEMKKYYEQALAILTKLVEETGSKELSVKKAICEFNLTGQIPESRETDDETGAAGKKKGAAAPAGPEDDQVLLHNRMTGEAEEAWARGDYETAAECWGKAYESLRELLVQAEADLDIEQVLCREALHAGICCAECGKKKEAENWFEIVRNRLRPMENRWIHYFLDQRRAGRHFRSLCAEAYVGLAKITADADRRSGLLDEALEELHRIAEMLPEAENLYDLAYGYFLAGQLDLLGDADLYYEEASRFCAQGRKRYPEFEKFAGLELLLMRCREKE